MHIRLFLVSASLLLCACTQKTLLQQVYEWSDQNAEENTPKPAIVLRSDAKGVLKIPYLDLRIKTTVPLETVQTDSNMFDVTGTGARTFFIRRVEYGHRSEGLGDWQILASVGESLDSDEACTVLPDAGSGVYLPVQTDRLMQCAVFVNGNGDRIIAVVGYSYTFEGPDFPGSMLVIPRKNYAIVLSDLISFSAFDNWISSKIDIFYREHSNDNLWPPTTPAAEAFYTDASDYVGRMIAGPSKEVVDAMYELEQWSSRITLD